MSEAEKKRERRRGARAVIGLVLFAACYTLFGGAAGAREVHRSPDPIPYDLAWTSFQPSFVYRLDPMP